MNRFGSLVCHQISERTLILNGKLLPLCARCTGIYAGFLIGLIYQILMGKRNASSLPPLTVNIISSLLIFGLMIEGWGEKLQWWQLSNQMRLLIGLLTGSSISVILFPLFNYFLRKKTASQTLNRDFSGSGQILTEKHYLILLVLVSFFFGLHLWPNSFVIFSSISLAGILAIYFVTNITFSAMALNWRKREANGKTFLLLSGFVLSLFIAEILILNKVHEKL